MLEFLSFVENTTDTFAAQAISPLIKELHKKVTEIKESKEMKVQYMTLLQRDRENINIKLGHKEGSEQMASLARILLSENCIEDLKRASDDIDFRKELFEKYGIL